MFRQFRILYVFTICVYILTPPDVAKVAVFHSPNLPVTELWVGEGVSQATQIVFSNNPFKLKTGNR